MSVTERVDFRRAAAVARADQQAAELDAAIVRMGRHPDCDLRDLAQLCWARGLYPEASHTSNVLQQIAVTHPDRAAELADLLWYAENGRIPRGGVWPAYGARAIRR